MVGGATTSELHVALKISPVYGGPVLWMKDASQNALAVSKLLNDKQKQEYVESLNKRYEELRSGYNNVKQTVVDINEARKNKLNLFN